MKLHILFGITAVSLVVFGACGSDDDDDGGAAGSGGTDSDASTGGTSAGSGGTTSGGTGGVVTGGTAGMAQGGAGGTTMTACPATAPADTDPCGDVSLGAFCAYAETECRCLGSWDCAAPAQGCPAAAPEDMGECPDLGGTTCRYPSADCLCTQAENWNCIEYAQCPATAPTDDTACADLSGAFCQYGDTQCFCPANETWNCVEPLGGGGAGGGPANEAGCLETAPTTGTACDTAGANCRYADATCVCRTVQGGDEQWFCFEL